MLSYLGLCLHGSHCLPLSSLLPLSTAVFLNWGVSSPLPSLGDLQHVWRLGGVQGCCQSSHSAQDSPPQQIAIWSKMSLVPLLRNPLLQGSWSANSFSTLRSPCGVDCGPGYRKMKVSLVIQICLHSEFDSWKVRIQGVSTASFHSLSKHRQTDRHTHANTDTSLGDWSLESSLSCYTNSSALTFSPS